MDTESHLEPRGRVVRDFLLLGSIGEGGQGEVFEAQCLVDAPVGLARLRKGERVAVKKLRGSRDKYALRELEIGPKLQHEHIVRYHGHFFYSEFTQGPEHAYVVMELLKGRTLNQYLDQGLLLWSQLAKLFLDCLSALQYAQDQNVVHRDIKPSNIFIAEPGGESDRQVVKLLDFGAAKMADSETSQLVGAGDNYHEPAPIARVPGYENQGDIRSDIFNIGMCIFHAVARRLPFHGESERDAFWKRVSQQGGAEFSLREFLDLPEKPDRSWDAWVDRTQIHTGLEALFATCLSPRPQRAAFFGEVAVALRKVAHRRIRGKQGEYELLEICGSGGFATVFKARHPLLGIVAAKQLRPGRRNHEELVKRFKRERDVLKKHRTPPMPDMFELIGPDKSGDGLHYLIMEFLWGMPEASLQKRIEKERRLPLVEVVVDFCHYLVQLHNLHRAGIFHRDIKPGNLYAPHRETDRACVFDLGIVHVEGGDLTEISAPATPEYMSFEFVQVPLYPGSVQADLFALGLSLHAAITGTLPIRQLREFLPEVIRERAPQFARDAELRIRGADLDAFADAAVRLAADPQAPVEGGEALRVQALALVHQCRKQFRDLLPIHRRDFYARHEIQLSDEVFDAHPALGALILRAVQFDPKLRPASAVEMLDGLLDCLATLDPAQHATLLARYQHLLPSEPSALDVTEERDTTGGITEGTHDFGAPADGNAPEVRAAEPAPAPTPAYPAVPPRLPSGRTVGHPVETGRTRVFAPTHAGGATAPSRLPPPTRITPPVKRDSSQPDPRPELEKGRGELHPKPKPHPRKINIPEKPRLPINPRFFLVPLLFLVLLAAGIYTWPLAREQWYARRVAALVGDLAGRASVEEISDPDLERIAALLNVLEDSAGESRAEPWQGWIGDLDREGRAVWSRDEALFEQNLGSGRREDLVAAARRAAGLPRIQGHPSCSTLGVDGPGVEGIRAQRWEKLLSAATAALLRGTAPPAYPQALDPAAWTRAAIAIPAARELLAHYQSSPLARVEEGAALGEWRATLAAHRDRAVATWTPTPVELDGLLAASRLDAGAAASAAAAYATEFSTLLNPSWEWRTRHAEWADKLARAVRWQAAAAPAAAPDPAGGKDWRAAVRQGMVEFTSASQAWRAVAAAAGTNFSQRTERHTRDITARLASACDALAEGAEQAYQAWLDGLSRDNAVSPSLRVVAAEAKNVCIDGQLDRLLAEVDKWQNQDWPGAVGLAGRLNGFAEPRARAALGTLQKRVDAGLGGGTGGKPRDFCTAYKDRLSLAGAAARLKPEEWAGILPAGTPGMKNRLENLEREIEASWGGEALALPPAAQNLPAVFKALSSLSKQIGDCLPNRYVEEIVLPRLPPLAGAPRTHAEFNRWLEETKASAGTGLNPRIEAEWRRALACALARGVPPADLAGPSLVEWVKFLDAAGAFLSARGPTGLQTGECQAALATRRAEWIALLAARMKPAPASDPQPFAWVEEALKAGVLPLLTAAQREALLAGWAAELDKRWKDAGSVAARDGAKRSLDDLLGLLENQNRMSAQEVAGLRKLRTTWDDVAKQERVRNRLALLEQLPTVPFEKPSLASWVRKMVDNAENAGDADPDTSKKIADYLVGRAAHGKPDRTPKPREVETEAETMRGNKLLNPDDLKKVKETVSWVTSSFLVEVVNPFPSNALDLVVTGGLPEGARWSLTAGRDDFARSGAGFAGKTLSTPLRIPAGSSVWVVFANLPSGEMRASLRADPVDPAYEAPALRPLDVKPGSHGLVPLEECMPKEVVLSWREEPKNPVRLAKLRLEGESKDPQISPDPGGATHRWGVRPQRGPSPTVVELVWTRPDYQSITNSQVVLPASSPLPLNGLAPVATSFLVLPQVEEILGWIAKARKQAKAVDVDLHTNGLARTRLSLRKISDPFPSVPLDSLDPATREYFELWRAYARDPRARAGLANWAARAHAGGDAANACVWSGKLADLKADLFPDPLGIPVLKSKAFDFGPPLVLPRVEDDEFGSKYGAVDFAIAGRASAGAVPFLLEAEKLMQRIANMVAICRVCEYLDPATGVNSDTEVAAVMLVNRLRDIGESRTILRQWRPDGDENNPILDALLNLPDPALALEREVGDTVSFESTKNGKKFVDVTLRIQYKAYLRWCLSWSASRPSSRIDWLKKPDGGSTDLISEILKVNASQVDLAKWLVDKKLLKKMSMPPE